MEMTTTQDDGDRTGSEPPGSNWTGGRVAGLVFASLAALVGLLILLAGIGLFVVHGVTRDDGFYTSDREPLQTPTYAITTERIALEPGTADDVPEGMLGDLRVQAEATGGKPVFLGVGPTVEVERYLDGVARARFVDFRRGAAVLHDISGEAPPGSPGDQGFWVASSEGDGDQRIDWDPDDGVWTVAVLNADGSRGVAVDADIGAEIPALIWVALGLTVVGLIVTVAAILLILHVGRRASRDGPA
jgi:hypothetical protein